MAIVINGDGTITGLSAGGLPDASVATADIAADAIDGTKLADNAINSEHYTDASIDEAHIANDAVNFSTHLKAGTDGELITWDASGDPAAVAVGTATHVLTSGGTGVAPTFQAAGGGAWTLIGAQDGSPSSSLTQTGMDSSTYKMFCVVMSSIVPTGNGSNVQLLLGDSNGIDEGGSDYARHTQFSNANSGSYGTAQVSTSSSVIMVGVGIGNSASYGVSGVLYISHGVGTNAYPMVTGNITYRDSGGNYVGGSVMAWRHAAITLDRVRLQGGASINGNLAVYGLNLS